MNTINIKQEKRILLSFIREHWNDDKLAAVYAFAEDGKMNFWNCCSCLLGVTLAKTLHTHHCPDFFKGLKNSHYGQARELAGAIEAEISFHVIAEMQNSMKIFLNLLRAEMRLRAWQRQRVQKEELVHA